MIGKNKMRFHIRKMIFLFLHILLLNKATCMFQWLYLTPPTYMYEVRVNFIPKSFGYATWLCDTTNSFGYATWLCDFKFIPSFGYATCDFIPSFGYTTWLHDLAMRLGYMRNQWSIYRKLASCMTRQLVLHLVIWDTLLIRPNYDCNVQCIILSGIRIDLTWRNLNFEEIWITTC